ncbi:NUDIX domain-containing protein [Streptomyces sp. NPDC059783]|uniref:NUDIX hydrolase n=2 Tax=unclassified Streptomyces TaxID=2593676 RepID=UPI00365DD72A
MVSPDREVLHVAAADSPGPPSAAPRSGDGSLLATAVRAVHEQTGIPPGDLCLTSQCLRTPWDIAPALGPGKMASGAPIADLRFAFYLIRAPHAATSWRPLARTGLAKLGRKAEELSGQASPLNASALIHNARGEYLLHLRDMRPDIWAPGCWALPGGGREPGDLTPEDTILRELKEEADLTPTQIEPFHDAEVTGPAGLTTPVRIFAARWEGDPARLPLTEGVMLHWFSPDTVRRLRLGGETLDLVLRHAESVTYG